ncbi:MAG: NUDIX domain-containing protein [bacterium]|nr:NUDIX domain-containing protein [bacterium]
MPTVECNSIKGGKISVSLEKLVFRPSVYGVIIHDDKILMLRNKSNGKLFFPGGGVNLAETLSDALSREIREETGIEIEVEKFLHFKEQFFYWDPGDVAYHMFNFFYICQPKTFILLNDDEVDDEEAEKPRWIDIDKVKHATDNLEAVKEIFQLL